MKRLFGLLACVLIILTVPLIGFSQRIVVPQLRQETDSWLKPFTENLSAIGKVDIGLKIGVKGMTCHFNLPIESVPPFFFYSLFYPSPVDFDMKKETLWVGAIESQVQLPRNFSMFLNGEGSVPKTVAVTMGQDPFQQLMVLWDGSKTQWWETEGGILYNFLSDYYFIIGLRFDQLSLKLDNPRDQLGLYQQILQDGNQDLYTSDMNVKTWIPFLGIRLKGLNYKADLLYSPFSSAIVALPFRYRLDFADPTVGGPFAFQQENYTMNNFGAFFEGSFEYRATVINNFGIDLWAKASYLSVRGSGNEDSTRSGFGYEFGELYDGTSSATAQGAFNTYSLSAGIGVSLSL
jgi:hypothetical protein